MELVTSEASLEVGGSRWGVNVPKGPRAFDQTLNTPRAPVFGVTHGRLKRAEMGTLGVVEGSFWGRVLFGEGCKGNSPRSFGPLLWVSGFSSMKVAVCLCSFQENSYLESP